MKYLIVVCAVLSLSFIGCGSPRIDASSDERMKESIAAVKQSLGDEERKEFEESLKILALSDVDNLLQLAADPNGMQRRLKEKLDGKSAREVIADAKKVKAERRARQREQIVREVNELQEKRKRALEAEAQLKSFAVDRSRFYFNQSGFRRQAVIELSVRNGTTHAVSRAYFHGVLATPGRSVPWVEEDFNYSISGGLEPGESATWQLVPNMFGEWDKAPIDRDDMVLTVTVTRIDGPQGEPVFDAQFPESDGTRLEELKRELSELDVDRN